MSTLTAGQRSPLSRLGLGLQLTVTPSGDLVGTDFSTFGLIGGKLSDDRYMVFYNQPSSPDGAVSWDGTRFTVDLGRLAPHVGELVFTATHDDQPLTAATALAIDIGGHTFDAHAALQGQKAAMLARLYRHSGEWRLEAIGQGFDGGLAALVTHYGGEVAEAGASAPAAPGAPPAPAPPTPPVRPPPPQAPPVNLSKVELRKHKVGVELRKHGIEHERLRVILIMDASGSMYGEYTSGKVQETLERLVPVAMRLDTDESLEFLYYATNWADMGVVDAARMSGFVGTEVPQRRRAPDASGGGSFLGFGRRKGTATPSADPWSACRKLGIQNEEPRVMGEVLRRHREDRQPTPTLVLFITDGGIYRSAEISKLLVESSREDVFWQFVGLGRQDYGILAALDTLPGRTVDNAGFFALDDISRITDDRLYARLLSELPVWLRAARQAGIVR